MDFDANASNPPLGPPDLEAQGVCVEFDGVRALDGCSLSLAPGEILGLIGPNGAGKTSLFNVLTGTVKPTRGRVFFQNTDITEWPAFRRARAGLARTFQIAAEFSGLSVLDNLCLAAPMQVGENPLHALFSFRRSRRQQDGIDRKARAVLDVLKLSPLADEPARNLSGGQKRLLELGRAMMTDPKIILLDEPAAGVNPTLMQQLVHEIRVLNNHRGIGFVIIEHDMPLVEALCHRVLCLHMGQHLKVGSFQQVRDDPSVCAAYLGEDVGAPP